ncbi:hypothetical protein H8959_018032 [Pygathrix nigripes]
MGSSGDPSPALSPGACASLQDWHLSRGALKHGCSWGSSQRFDAEDGQSQPTGAQAPEPRPLDPKERQGPTCSPNSGSGSSSSSSNSGGGVGRGAPVAGLRISPSSRPAAGSTAAAAPPPALAGPAAPHARARAPVPGGPPCAPRGLRLDGSAGPRAVPFDAPGLPPPPEPDPLPGHPEHRGLPPRLHLRSRHSPPAPASPAAPLALPGSGFSRLRPVESSAPVESSTCARVAARPDPGPVPAAPNDPAPPARAPRPRRGCCLWPRPRAQLRAPSPLRQAGELCRAAAAAAHYHRSARAAAPLKRRRRPFRRRAASPDGRCELAIGSHPADDSHGGSTLSPESD